MKNLILTMGLAAITAIGLGQDLRKNEVDDFTGVSKKITGYYEIAEGIGKLAVSVYHIGDIYGIYCFSTSDLGCCGANGNYLIFKFTDGTTLKLDEDLADVDCSDRCSSIYRVDPNEFKGKTVEKIRVQMSEYYDDRISMGTFTIQQLFEAVE